MTKLTVERLLSILSGVLFIVFVGLLWVNNPISISTEKLVQIDADEACVLQNGYCEMELSENQRVKFKIDPAAIPVITPLTLSVEVMNLNADSVIVDFAGVDMDMGYNRNQLQRLEQEHFQGRGMLPVCVRSKMEWLATVTINSGDTVYRLPFRFWTKSK